jgi:hypothetical protein
MLLLSRLFVATSDSPKATNLKDIIYGVMGMISDAETCGINVDYNKAKEEIYRDTTQCLIRQGHSGVLAWCQHPESFPEYPSWVPHFDKHIEQARGEPRFKSLFSVSGSYASCRIIRFRS